MSGSMEIVQSWGLNWPPTSKTYISSIGVGRPRPLKTRELGANGGFCANGDLRGDLVFIIDMLLTSPVEHIRCAYIRYIQYAA